MRIRLTERIVALTAERTSLSLLELARAHDDEAWGQLVHLYGPLVHRWCLRAGLNDADTADVFQETFRAVAANLEGFSPQRSVGSFRSWLRSIVRSKVNDHFRLRQKQTFGQGGTEANIQLANVEDQVEDDSEEDAETDNALVVRRAMAMIKPEFSEQNWNAFCEIVIQGNSATDVAKRLGVAPQTIRQANYRIRRRLRVVLKDLVD